MLSVSRSLTISLFLILKAMIITGVLKKGLMPSYRRQRENIQRRPDIIKDQAAPPGGLFLSLLSSLSSSSSVEAEKAAEVLL